VEIEGSWFEASSGKKSVRLPSQPTSWVWWYTSIIRGWPGKNQSLYLKKQVKAKRARALLK
jgi:hypothetical protein